VDLETETFATSAKLKLHKCTLRCVCEFQDVWAGLCRPGVETTTVIEPRHQQPTSRYKDISYTSGQNKRLALRSVGYAMASWVVHMYTYYRGLGVAEMPKRNEIIKKINNNKNKYIYGNGSAKKR